MYSEGLGRQSILVLRLLHQVPNFRHQPVQESGQHRGAPNHHQVLSQLLPGIYRTLQGRRNGHLSLSYFSIRATAEQTKVAVCPVEQAEQTSHKFFGRISRENNLEVIRLLAHKLGENWMIFQASPCQAWQDKGEGKEESCSRLLLLLQGQYVKGGGGLRCV